MRSARIRCVRSWLSKNSRPSERLTSSSMFLFFLFAIVILLDKLPSDRAHVNSDALKFAVQIKDADDDTANVLFVECHRRQSSSL